jgi:hypothetical protein
VFSLHVQSNKIHGYAMRSVFENVMDNEFLDMYAKCGDVSIARRLFKSHGHYICGHV